MTPGLFPGGPVVPVAAFSWKPLEISGGGLCLKMEIHADGTMVTASDVGGGYFGSCVSLTDFAWTSAFNAGNMPSLVGTFANGAGCADIRIAASDSSRRYAVYQIDNKVTTSGLWRYEAGVWTLTAETGLTAQASFSNQHPQALLGHIMAVSPANADVLLFGNSTLMQARMSTDGGATFATISAIPTPTATPTMGDPPTPGAYYGLAFDPTFPGRMAFPSWGNQVTIGTNILGTPVWTPTIGGPIYVTDGRFAIDGNYYAAEYNPNTNVGNLWRLSTLNVWTLIYTKSGASFAVACSTTDAAEITIGDGAASSNTLQRCTNANSGSPTFPGFSTSVSYVAPAGQSTWQVASNDQDMTICQIAYDPINANIVHVAAGNGTFYTDVTTLVPGGDATFNITFKGITNVVGQSIAASPSRVYSTQWDRPVFAYDEATNAGCTTYGPSPSVGVVNVACTVDWCRQTPSAAIAVLPVAPHVFITTNNGATWTGVATDPIGGHNATPQMATLTDFMVQDLEGQVVKHTLDGGSTWTVPTGLPTIPVIGTNTRMGITADTVNIGDYYIYIPGFGVYYYAAGSGAWVLQSSSIATSLSGNDGGGMNFKAAYGVAGLLAITCGPNGGSAQPHPATGNNAGLYISTDKGVTWSKVPNVNEPLCLGWGLLVPGESHPSLFFYGWNGTALADMGTWRTGDLGATLHSLGQTNGFNWGTPIAIDGSKTVPGSCVVMNTYEVGQQGGAIYSRG